MLRMCWAHFFNYDCHCRPFTTPRDPFAVSPTCSDSLLIAAGLLHVPVLELLISMALEDSDPHKIFKTYLLFSVSGFQVEQVLSMDPHPSFKSTIDLLSMSNVSGTTSTTQRVVSCPSIEKSNDEQTFMPGNKETKPGTGIIVNSSLLSRLPSPLQLKKNTKGWNSLPFCTLSCNSSLQRIYVSEPYNLWMLRGEIAELTNEVVSVSLPHFSFSLSANGQYWLYLWRHQQIVGPIMTLLCFYLSRQRSSTRRTLSSSYAPKKYLDWRAPLYWRYI